MNRQNVSKINFAWRHCLRSAVAFAAMWLITKLMMHQLFGRVLGVSDFAFDLPDRAVYLIGLFGQLLIFSSVLRYSVTFDRSARDVFDSETDTTLRATLTAPDTGISFAVTLIGTILLALRGETPLLLGALYLGTPPNHVLAVVSPVLILTPIFWGIDFLVRRSVRLYWASIRHTELWGSLNARWRLFFRAVLLVCTYVLIFPILPLGVSYFGYSVWNILRMAKNKITLPGVIAVFLGFFLAIRMIRYANALKKRRRFLNRLRDICEDRGYELSPMVHAFRSVFRSDTCCHFTVRVGVRCYSCHFVTPLRYFVPLCFHEDGTAEYRFRLNFSRKHPTYISYRTGYRFDGEGKKIVIVTPMPHDAYAVEGKRQKRLISGDPIWDYRVFDADSFLGSLDRDCLDRFSEKSF